MFDHKAGEIELKKLASKMQERNFEVEIVVTKEAALAAVKKTLPDGAEVMTGSSTTLKEIGLMDYLSSKDSKFTFLQEQVNQENDEKSRQDLRRHSLTADYFISSVNAVTADGALVAVDATGSRVGAMPFAAKKLILVIGSQKITANLEEAMRRIKEYVFPLENKRAMVAYGVGSMLGKWIIFEREAISGRVKVILVKESLGF